MAMEGRSRWDEQRESMGEITDQPTQRPQDEREAVQKRTFTRWMNVFLRKCEPAVEVHDLFTDIQDGRVLMALLEELSGCKLVYRFRSSSHRIFRLNNISKALAFLDDRHVNLLGIDASSIMDGIPSVVLKLIWNIILFFQIQEVTRSLQKRFSSSLSSLSISSSSSGEFSSLSSGFSSYSCSTLPTKGRRAARTPKHHGKTVMMLLHWVQSCTSKFGVEVQDFGKSWRSGLAFLALIKSIDPVLIDLRDGLSREPRENIQEALRIAQHSLGIPALLEPLDVICASPDERSIITYVSMFLEHHSDTEEDHTTDSEMRINIPEIPSFTSVESISFGDTLSDHPEAQALLQGLEKTNEQLLWRRWARGSSGEHHVTSPQLRRPISIGLPNTRNTASFYDRQSRNVEQSLGDVATSQLNGENPLGVIRPNGPLTRDTDNTDQDVLWWLEYSTEDQVYKELCVDEGNFSQSSEEGIYNLPALGSDGEDAYSYILDLNGEVFQSHKLLTREIQPKTAKETTSDRWLARESKLFNTSLIVMDAITERYSGCHNGLLAQNGALEREVEHWAQSVDQDSKDVKERGINFEGGQQRARDANRFKEKINDRKRHFMKEEAENFRKVIEQIVWEQQNSSDSEEREEKKMEERANLCRGLSDTDGDVTVEDSKNWESITGSNCTQQEKEEEDSNEKERTAAMSVDNEKESVNSGLFGNAAKKVYNEICRGGNIKRKEGIRREFSKRFGKVGRLAIAEADPLDGSDERETECKVAGNAELSEDAGLEKGVEEQGKCWGFQTFGLVKLKREVEHERKEDKGQYARRLQEWEDEREARKQEEAGEDDELEDVIKKEDGAEVATAVNLESFKMANKQILSDKPVYMVKEIAGIRDNEEKEDVRRGKTEVIKMDDVVETEGEERASVDLKTEEEGEDNKKFENAEVFERRVTVEKRKREANQDNERYNFMTVTSTDLGHSTDVLKENLKMGTDLHNDHQANPNMTPACSATFQSSSGGHGITQFLAASCEVTPLQVECLLVLWLLLYCYFILPHMNL